MSEMKHTSVDEAIVKARYDTYGRTSMTSVSVSTPQATTAATNADLQTAAKSSTAINRVELVTDKENAPQDGEGQKIKPAEQRLGAPVSPNLDINQTNMSSINMKTTTPHVSRGRTCSEGNRDLKGKYEAEGYLIDFLFFNCLNLLTIVLIIYQ